MLEPDLDAAEPGRRSRGPRVIGNRPMAILAALALLGGVAVAVGNLLPPRDLITAEATASPRGTPAATRSEPPDPTERPRVQILVEPGATAPAAEERPIRWAWIRVHQVLTVHAVPQPDGVVIGRLEPGAIARVRDPGDSGEFLAGWWFIADTPPVGWIQADDDGAPAVDLFVDSPATTVGIRWLAATDSGFVAVLQDEERVALAASPDGARWTRMAPADARLSSWLGLAWGPAGWLSQSAGEEPGRADSWLSHSVNGTDWRTLGSLEMDLRRIVGSPAGYLAVGHVTGGFAWWWTSENGLTWSGLPDPGIPQAGRPGIVAGPAGFYVWEKHLDLQDSDPRGAFLGGAGTWQVLGEGPSGPNAQVVALGDGFIGLDQDPSGGTVRSWRGKVTNGVLAWDEPDDLSALMGNAAIALLTGDDARALAITWDRGTDEISSWISTDGAHWGPIPAPAGGFGVIPHIGAGSAAGIVVAGMGSLASGEELQLWRFDGGRWVSVDVGQLTGHFAPRSCPPFPRDALDLLLVSPSDAPRCWGARPVTVRAFAYGSPEFSVSLAPLPMDWGWWGEMFDPMPGMRDAFVDPSAAGWPSLPAWVEVTGHFDDPGAMECRQELDAEDEAWYEGRASLIEECRRRFVITAVTAVDGP